MSEISIEKIQELAEKYNIPLSDGEASQVVDQVNSNVSEVREIWEAGLSERQKGGGDRTWQEPTENPHNALITKCNVQESDEGPLTGVEVGLKDIIMVAGVPMTGGSEALHGFVPSEDATVTRRLLEAGAKITAKTNLDELAGGARGFSFYGQMTHPDDENHIPGGSSGGSAVAVRKGIVDVALGTDTGGSIRMPSAHCGIIGLKPTYGLVSMAGVFENSYSLDHIGPMTNSVIDAARVLETLAGTDLNDPRTLEAAGRTDYDVGHYVDALSDTSANPTIGVLEEGFGRGTADQQVRPDIVKQTEKRLDQLADAGAELVPISIKDFELCGPIKYAISYTELAMHWRDKGGPGRGTGTGDSRYHQGINGQLTSHGEAINPYYRSRLLAGAYTLEENGGIDYPHAQELQKKIRSQFRSAFSDVDVLALPTLPILPPEIEEAANPGYNYSRNTYPANITGYPAISLPNGRIDGLPVGIQLMAEPFEEQRLLRISQWIDSECAPEATSR